MKTVAILYATREGHTRMIAERLAATLRTWSLTADVIDVAAPPDRFNLEIYSAAMLAASVHVGKHESEMIDFVRTNRQALEQIPTVFLSVSLSEAGVEDETAPPDQRAKAAADVERMIDQFLKETGWHPSRIQAVAGALLYTRYNFLIRLVMKRIARAAGGSTDTAHDHDYTNWTMLDHLADDLAIDLGATQKNVSAEQSV
jgi:menaquinone-dependent protoporphyrinogen oxidase